jgi:hypothetical protein
MTAWAAIASHDTRLRRLGLPTDGSLLIRIAVWHNPWHVDGPRAVGHAPRLGESVIRGRFVWAVGLVALLSGTVGCSAASVSTAPTKTSASPSTSVPTLSASSTPSAQASALTVISVPGYTYTDPPAEVKQMAEGLDASGMVTSTVGRGVKDGSGTEVGAIILFQYNPKLTVLLDKTAPSKILDGAVNDAKANIPGKPTVTAHVLSGSHVRLVQSASIDLDGGRLQARRPAD